MFLELKFICNEVFWSRRGLLYGTVLSPWHAISYHIFYCINANPNHITYHILLYFNVSYSMFFKPKRHITLFHINSDYFISYLIIAFHMIS